MSRPTREQIHITTAKMWALRSVCKRLKVGAVITDLSMRRVLAVGYNGPASGLDHERCNTEEGNCGCLHAECNAIARVDNTLPGKIIFVTISPCVMCAQMIIQAGITKVYYVDEYRDREGLWLLERCHVEVERIPERLVLT